MPSMVILGSYTDQGIQNLKDLPERLEATKAVISEAGGRLISFYLTMGAHDFVATVEVPDIQTGARLSLQTASQGNIRSETMYAFTEEETAAITSGL
jgi:uncharacterized protein with GYD domain